MKNSRMKLRTTCTLALLAGLIVLIACATPIGVAHVSARAARRDLTRSALSNGRPSIYTQNVLNGLDFEELYNSRPEEALKAIHERSQLEGAPSPLYFALAELSFVQAERSKSQAYYLAAAIYAYAYLFPADPASAPSSYDARARLACDLYNRGLTLAFQDPKGLISPRPGTFKLPFGEIELAFDDSELDWFDRRLDKFMPVNELLVRGLKNRYRQSGIGAALAASAPPQRPEDALTAFVAPRLKVSVTLLLTLERPRIQLRGNKLSGRLDIYSNPDIETVKINDQQIPLEREPSATMAYMIMDSPLWKRGIFALLHGNLLLKNETRLRALRPYRRGSIPIVFVHGTASNATTWADMCNELENDPEVRRNFQFWFFSYDTGNPIAYSAMLLRKELNKIVKTIDPEGTDPALRNAVVIGHSQGGLLAKLTVIDSGDRFWTLASKKSFDELKVTSGSRELLRDSLFVKPVPCVRRVIFISTPQRGSYVAGNRIAHWFTQFMTFPEDLLKVSSDLVQGDTTKLEILTRFKMPTSVDNMTPTNPFLKTLASIPVSNGIAAHSIISVKGTGPYEKGNDGVVEYSSAHIDGVESELVVRSNHSCQSKAATIDEVRRILMLQLDEYGKRIGSPAPTIPAATDDANKPALH